MFMETTGDGAKRNEDVVGGGTIATSEDTSHPRYRTLNTMHNHHH